MYLICQWLYISFFPFYIIHLLLKENFESLCFVLFDWFEWRGSITTVGVRNMRIKIWWKIVFYPLMTESFIVLLSLKLIFRLLSAFGCWKEKRQGNEAFGSLCLLLVLLVSVAMKNLRKKILFIYFSFFSLNFPGDKQTIMSWLMCFDVCFVWKYKNWMEYI